MRKPWNKQKKVKFSQSFEMIFETSHLWPWRCSICCSCCFRCSWSSSGKLITSQSAAKSSILEKFSIYDEYQYHCLWLIIFSVNCSICCVEKCWNVSCIHHQLHLATRSVQVPCCILRLDGKDQKCKHRDTVIDRKRVQNEFGHPLFSENV